MNVKRTLFNTSHRACVKSIKDGTEFVQEPEEEGKAKDRNDSPLKMLDDSADFSGLKPLTVDDIWATPTYPKGTPNPLRDQSKHFKAREGMDPSLTSIILFPGQGVQYVGMVKEIVDVCEHLRYI